MKIDYYGDSYHHWLISYLTIKNNWVYTDFKPNTMNLVWLPLYHYLTAFLMNLTQTWDISILHWLNLILGSLTCLLTYILTLQLSNDNFLAFSVGLSLSIHPWFIELNVLGLTETLTVFLLILVLMFYFHFKLNSFLPILMGLLMLTRYEAWFFLSLLTLFLQKKKKVFINCIYVIASIFLIWCLWSYVNVSDPLAWFKMQKSMVKWDWLYTYGRINLKGVIEYPKLIMKVTSNLFVLGLISGVLNFKNKNLRLIFILTILYTIFLSIQFYLGNILLQPRHIIYLLPFTGILYAQLFLSKKSLINKAILLMIVFIPTITYGSMLTVKTEKSIEIKVGESLKKIYDGGFIICDSPTVIYYSGIPPEKFYSTNNLFWYKDSWNKVELQNWFLNHNVKYIIWENTSYSATWWLFPELKENQILKFDSFTLKLIYSEESNSLSIKIFKIYYYYEK
ncbi:MAG: hypothetical protein QXL69_03535 [Candidatus Bathyarchaeia archaeon]